MLNRLNLFLALAFVLLLVALMFLRVDHSRPNYEVHMGDDMSFSPSYSPYEANDNFPSGRTMQNPVPGTIAQGSMPLHYEATPADAIRAGEELVNPFDPTADAGKASTERGQTVYQSFCVACHGGDGAGNGLVAQRGFPPPPSLLTGKSVAMKDGQLLHILTFGQNSMPSFATMLPPDRRWDVLNYIRSLQAATPEVKAESPESSVESQEPVVEVTNESAEAATETAPKTEPKPPATEPEATVEPDASPDADAPAEDDTESKS